MAVPRESSEHDASLELDFPVDRKPSQTKHYFFGPEFCSQHEDVICEYSLHAAINCKVQCTYSFSGLTFYLF